MRIPDPKANTTTEAYLAYKAGYLEESELKPVLYEPYLHFDAWLAYWAALANDFPAASISKKNMLRLKDYSARGVDIKLAAGGMISVSGTTQNNYANFMTYHTPIDLKAGVYTFSRVGDKTYAVSLTVYNEDKTQYTSINITAGNSSSTANIAFDIKYIAGAFTGLTVGSNLDFVTGLQLEAGSEASEFEPSAIPEMLCDEEALVAYLSGVTNTYPEEIKDPYDVRIVGYLKHLVSARWPEPDYPVNNEEFYLSTMEPPHTSNPVPSSDIELDTAEGKIISVEAYGDTYQQTYSGYQLLEKSGMATPSSDTDFWISLQNMTLTPEEDGWGKFTPGSVGNVDKQMFVRREGVSGLEYSTEYTVIVELRDITNHDGYITFAQYAAGDDPFASGSIIEGHNQAGSAGISTSLSSFSGSSTTIVFKGMTKSTATSIGLRAFTSRSFTTTFGMRVTIIKGDHSSDWQNYTWEPYVGGTASPNPDYPQPIQVVTGEQTVTVTGKNKIDGSYSEISQTARCTAEASGNGFKITSTSSSGATYATVPIPNIASLLGQTVTVSYVATGDGIRTSFFYLDASGGATSSIGYSETVTLPDSLGSNAGIGVVFYTSNNGSATYNDIQLEIGSTTTAYQPYQSQSYSISLGSTELCKIGDCQDYIYKSGDDWYVHKETGKIDLTNTSGWWASGTHTIKNSLTNLGISNIHTVGVNRKTEALCNYFAACPSNRLYQGTDTVGFGISDGFYFSNNDWSLGDFNTFKSNNQILVCYELDTPTDTKITDDSLAGQLEALAGADTYNEKTYIKVTATDPNLPALLKVEAYKY